MVLINKDNILFSSGKKQIIFIKYFNCGTYSYLHLGMDVQWTKKQMLNSIEQYELQKCLWNVMSKYYKSQIKMKSAWQEISFHQGTNVEIAEKKN
jgi:hypothetical protein